MRLYCITHLVRTIGTTSRLTSCLFYLATKSHRCFSLPFQFYLKASSLLRWPGGIEQTRSLLCSSRYTFIVIITSLLIIAPQSYLFVTFNKVCTSQYFIWYLSLLPLAMLRLKLVHQSRKLLIALCGVWIGSQALWLASAYALEIRGVNTYLVTWTCSLVYVACNAFIARHLLQIAKVELKNE